MLNLLDRYLLQRYWQAFAILFSSLFGLFVVLDVFTNIDEFTRMPGGSGRVLTEMAKYYGYRTFAFFGTVGSIVSVMAALMALGLLLKNGELNPVLSAGIPTYRLAAPLFIGNIVISLLLVANQELVLPQFAAQLQIRPGQGVESVDKIAPAWDFVTNVQILNGRFSPKSRKLSETEFVLPVPELVTDLTTVRATEAVYLPKSKDPLSGGWYLSGTTPDFAALRLTERGQQFVLAGVAPDDIFIVSDITFERLVNRNKFFESLSTRELIENARNPSFGILSLRAQLVHLHGRMTRPLFNLLMVFMILPLVIRRESRALVTNLGMALAALTFALGMQQCCQYLGQSGLVRLDLAAWIPAIVCGILGTWFSGFIRT